MRLFGFPARPGQAPAGPRALAALSLVMLTLAGCLPPPPPPSASLPPPHAPSPHAPSHGAPGVTPTGLFGTPTVGSSDPRGATAPTIRAARGPVPFPIEVNVGQAPPDIAYLLRAGQTQIGFAQGGPRFLLIDVAPAADADPAAPLGERQSGPPRPAAPDSPLVAHTLTLELVGASAARPVGTRPADTSVSWFRGQPDQWQTGIAAFEQVAYPNAWPGIDVIYERGPGTAGLTSSYVVAAGADPSAIRLAWSGVQSAALDERGALVLTTPVGRARETAPIAWQDRADGGQDPVDVRFVLAGGDADPALAEVTFALGSYDRGRPLVIDPTFAYAGYIGGSSMDWAMGVAVDASGAAYVVGFTFSNSTSQGFPVVGGPSTAIAGSNDAFVAKVRPDGSGLVYAGYIGGTSNDDARGVAVDSTGAAYVVGNTSSGPTADGFPVTVGPALTFKDGGQDGFVARVRPDGLGLTYAGYVGGTDYDQVLGVAVDGTGAAYVIGDTQSDAAGEAFPASVGPNIIYSGDYDGFVVKVRADGLGFDYGGYIGGTQSDQAFGVAVDGSGAAYVVGFTNSNSTALGSGGHGFPAVQGPSTAYAGGTDGFVAKIQPGGAAFEYLGYLGGTQADRATAVAVDGGGAAYVVGDTSSNAIPVGSGGHGFPVNGGPDVTYNGSGDAFIVKVQPNGLGLSLAGYIGGASGETAVGVGVDGSGVAYVAGFTTSNPVPTGSGGDGFPAAGGPSSTFYNTNGDAFVAKLQANGVGLEYAGYVGGAGAELPFGLAVGATGTVYVVGFTSSNATPVGSGGDGFPATGGPGLTQRGSQDAFVAKVGNTHTPTPTTTATPTPTASVTPTSSPTPTGTATATTTATTTTATPTSTRTPVPTPQPPVSIAVALAGTNRLQVAITALDGLRSVAWTPDPGFAVELTEGSPLAGGVLTLPPNSRRAVFYVRRLTSTSVTVPLTITGAFGTWRTFVGGGPDAWQ